MKRYNATMLININSLNLEFDCANNHDLNIWQIKQETPSGRVPAEYLIKFSFTALNDKDAEQKAELNTDSSILSLREDIEPVNYALKLTKGTLWPQKVVRKLISFESLSA